VMAEVKGMIAPRPRGENGFGYDPIFLLPQHNCTMAELKDEEKNRISHRGLALEAMARLLLDRMKRS
ncbi:MAG: non-canonical purine NTP pyrophosphatase, partial [Ruminococcaceae bacterium]|nr:non-canonical purine NTP pyrophosphatase [Oscillospiraceae bacterium]